MSREQVQASTTHWLNIGHLGGCYTFEDPADADAVRELVQDLARRLNAARGFEVPADLEPR